MDKYNSRFSSIVLSIRDYLNRIGWQVMYLVMVVLETHT